MSRALWIGGPPGSGKTAVASRLARRYGLRLYSSDTRTWVHRDRALAAGNPAAQRWEALSRSSRREQPLPEMLAMSLHHERAEMIVADVLALPDHPLVVAEGTPVAASVVTSGVAQPSEAVWLLPTPDLQRERLAERTVADGDAQLYRHLAGVIAADVRANNVATIDVDGSLDLSAMVDLVAEFFGEALTGAPRAQSRAERQTLRREMNVAIVAQVFGFYGRPWAEGDPNRVTASFVCECGDIACVTDLQRTVGDVADVPVLAPGHDR